MHIKAICNRIDAISAETLAAQRGINPSINNIFLT